jgi:hypothetical protein
MPKWLSKILHCGYELPEYKDSGSYRQIHDGIEITLTVSNDSVYATARLRGHQIMTGFYTANRSVIDGDHRISSHINQVARDVLSNGVNSLHNWKSLA